MTTASHGPSLLTRVRTFALAGAIALGGMAPAALAARADGPTQVEPRPETQAEPPVDSAGAFDVNVDSVAELTGLTAVVAGGGDRVNLRDEPAHTGEVVTQLDDGTTVDLRIDRLDTVYGPDGVRWWPVSAGGVEGWVSGFYLAEAKMAADAPAQFTLDGPGLIGRTAVINGGGDGINLRTTPGHDGDVRDVLADGTVVELRIDREDTVYDADGVTRWWPVVVDGVEGWVSGLYLRDPDAAPADEPEAPADDEPAEPVEPAQPVEPAGQFTLDGDGLTGRTARVAGGGDGVNLRNAPDEDAGVILTVADGTIVNLQVDQFDTVLDDDGETRWWPVEVNGAAGWISGFFLEDSDEATEGDLADERAATTFAADAFVAVDTITDAGANVRADAAPSGRDIGSLREGDVVRVVEGPASFVNSANGWYLVTSGQLTGYVDGDLLTAAEAPTAAEDDTAVEGEFTDGDYAAATTRSGVGVNVREGASRLTSRVGFVPEAGIVQITDGPEYDEDGDPWYRITDGELSGWIAANLLEASAAPPLEEEPDDEEGAEPEPAPAEPTGGLVYPVDGRITQNFGCSDLGFYEFDPDFGCAVHDGLDIAAPSYTPIVAADAGTVTFAGLCDCGLGYYVEIDHGNGIVTQYGHMAEQPYVATGQQVSQGETIGPIGSTGVATGPHVHFVVQVDGVAQDPLDFLS